MIEGTRNKSARAGPRRRKAHLVVIIVTALAAVTCGLPDRSIALSPRILPSQGKRIRRAPLSSKAVPDESGNVVEMKIVSGHGLLIQAAFDAVRQWKYEPTYLNDEPVAVQMFINVSFQLSQ